MKLQRLSYTRGKERHQGSVYLLVLGACLLVATIGVAGVLAARVDNRSVSSDQNVIRARELARTAIDRGLWEVKNNDLLWRTVFAADTMRNISLGDGTFTLTVIDPVDNDLLNNNTDVVVLYGIGKAGACKYTLSVILNGDGSVMPGTWRRIVN